MPNLEIMMFKKIFITGFFLLAQQYLFAQQSSFVTLNPNGTLNYAIDAKGGSIPDFSAVGYHRSDAELPYIDVVKTVNAATSGSSQEVIQDAINEVALLPLNANGFRGAILFKAGTYLIPGIIIVPVSGIVLRGEGENSNGTKWVATGAGQRTLLEFSGEGSRVNSNTTRSDITDSFVPVGTYSFNVASTTGYNVGDEIVVGRPGTDQWIQDLKMDVIENVNGPEAQWKASEYDLYFEREITKIEGNKIYIDNPIVQEMEPKYGGGYIAKYSYPGRISEVGVEYIRFESEYANDTDEDHGWVAVKFSGVQHGWAKNIIARYFGYAAVHISGNSKYITVKDSKCLDAKSIIMGSRRYSFNIAGRAQLNLVSGCYATEGRHDFVTGARTGGPNVFHNSSSINAHSDVGPHQRWAIGTLYDNISTEAVINVQDRGPGGGNGHGWTGVTQVLWNCSSSKRISVQSPWVSGKNYAIAVQGTKYAGSYFTNRPDGEWELRNSNITPSSLFEAQLTARRKTLAPATLNSFYGELINNQIKLKWATSAENSLTSFVILHSTDNTTYTGIATVNSTNNSFGDSYSFTHTGIVTGNNFYQIKLLRNGAETILPYVITVSGTDVDASVLFKQDFNQGAFVQDYGQTGSPNKIFFDAIGVTLGTGGASASASLSNANIVFEKQESGSSTGISYLARTTDIGSANQLLMIKFDMEVVTSATATSGIQFLIGEGLSPDGSIETEANKLFSRLNFNLGASDFKVRANANTTASKSYSGKQTIRWYINGTSVGRVYTGPDSQVYSLGAKEYNVWVGNEKQYSANISASNPDVAIKNFKLLLTGGPSVCNFHDLEITQLDTALPVSMNFFTAKLQNKGALLQWQTLSEQNNSHFEILRSIDGIDFKKIGTERGFGNTQKATNYSFSDYALAGGVNYYKLKQVDFNGNSEEYGPVSVNNTLKKQGMTVSVSAEGTIYVNYTSEKAQSVELHITDLLGREVYSTILFLEEGTNRKVLQQTMTYSKGLHIASLKVGEMVYKTKFIN